jgi:hypothetical protein
MTQTIERVIDSPWSRILTTSKIFSNAAINPVHRAQVFPKSAPHENER